MPYRISFRHGGNHDLFVGDAGQNRWEEVSIAPRQRRRGEMYVRTTEETGPTGTTGKVLKLVRPSG